LFSFVSSAPGLGLGTQRDWLSRLMRRPERFEFRRKLREQLDRLVSLTFGEQSIAFVDHRVQLIEPHVDVALELLEVSVHLPQLFHYAFVIIGHSLLLFCLRTN
jgi:hypothetical protein